MLSGLVICLVLRLVYSWCEDVKLPFYPVDGFLCVLDDRQQNFPDIAWGQQSWNRQFVGTLYRLIEISAYMGQFALVSPVERAEFLHEFKLPPDAYVWILFECLAHVVAYGLVFSRVPCARSGLRSCIQPLSPWTPGLLPGSSLPWCTCSFVPSCSGLFATGIVLPYFAGRNSGGAAPVHGIRQVTFWENKRSFVATKVQLAWKILQRRAISSRVLFCAKITVESGFRTKCTTLFFKERTILTVVSRTSDCRVCQWILLCIYVYDVFRLCRISIYGMKIRLVSGGWLCRFIHPWIIGNIIRSSDNRREKETAVFI